MKVFRISLIALLALIVSYAGMWVYKSKHRERVFFEQAFTQMESGGESMSMITIDLKNGESASVILEHSCCSGAGFDAVAVRTSDGNEYKSTKNYCGLEGFYGSLSDVAMKDLNGFKAFLADEGHNQLRQ